MPASETLKLTPAQFETVAQLARSEFGLELGKGKESLVAARLGKQMRARQLRTFDEYHRHVLADRTGESLIDLIDALTTNHTNFFREPAHFDFLRTRILPHWRPNDRVWCAASSTGEEPYSIAMTLCEAGHPSTRILATDICTRVLTVARRGAYRADRFENPGGWMRRYLLRGSGKAEGYYRLRDEVRAMVEYRRLNLIEPLPDLGRFAVIFCRNVMIYFSRETQERVVRQLAACLEPGGYLMVGHAESLMGIRHGLEQVAPAIYRQGGGR